MIYPFQPVLKCCTQFFHLLLSPSTISVQTSPPQCVPIISRKFGTNSHFGKCHSKAFVAVLGLKDTVKSPIQASDKTLYSTTAGKIQIQHNHIINEKILCMQKIKQILDMRQFKVRKKHMCSFSQNLLVLLQKVLQLFLPSQSEMPMFLSPKKVGHAYLNYFQTHFRQEREPNKKYLLDKFLPDNLVTLLYDFVLHVPAIFVSLNTGL